MEVQFQDGLGLLVASATGSYSLEAMLPMLDKVAAEASARGVQRILLDLRDVTGDVPDLDRYELGKHAAKAFAHVDRLGVLRQARLRHTSLAFDVAQNRGLDARAFLDRTEAERWLTSG